MIAPRGVQQVRLLGLYLSQFKRCNDKPNTKHILCSILYKMAIFDFPIPEFIVNILAIEETSVLDLRSDGSTFSADRATVRVKSPCKATSRLLPGPDAVVVEFDVGFRSLHLYNITTLNHDSAAPGPIQSSSPDEKLRCRVGRSCARRHSARTLRPLTFMFRAANKLSSGQSLQKWHGGTVFPKEVGYESKR